MKGELVFCLIGVYADKHEILIDVYSQLHMAHYAKDYKEKKVKHCFADLEDRGEEWNLWYKDIEEFKVVEKTIR